MRGYEAGLALIVTPPCVGPLIAPHFGLARTGTPAIQLR